MLKEGNKQEGDSTGVTGPAMDVSMDIVASKEEPPTEGGAGQAGNEGTFPGRSDWSCQAGEGEWEGVGIPGRGHSMCKGTRACSVCGLLWLT